MPKDKKDKRKRSQKQSQNQRQSVVVNVLLAKHRAGRKPSGKKATPIFIQPPIRMNVSYGDILNREPPKPQLLGEDIRKLIAVEVKNPIAELRKDFLSRVESKPRTEIMEKPNEEMMKIILELDEIRKRPDEDEDNSLERIAERFNNISLGGGTSDTTDARLFEPRFIDGASIDMLRVENYGLTRTGNKRTAPTKKQRDAINNLK
jgi:hypothetical protein